MTATLNDAVRSGATPVTVVVGAAADAATEGTDYATVADFTVTIPDGETSADTTFTLTPTDDEVVEGDEALSVSGTTTVTGLTVTNTEVTLTDDDGSAAVTVDDASANEGDSITFTVTLDKAVQGGLTVTPSFSDGTATSTDYTANTTALTFVGTASETQTFKVATTEDAVIEDNETFTVGLAVSGTSAPVTDTDTATGTITNDDAASTGITLSVDPTSVAEDDTATTVTVTATLNDAVRSGATPVTVVVGAAADAATEGTDYATVADFTVTIPDGETSADTTFTLTPTDDEVVEGDEALSVSGTTTVTGLTVTNTEVTLTDDDGSAAVTVDDASANEGDSITFTVTLDKAVQGGLTVTPSFSGGTATSTDYTANTTALTFAGTASETQTFKVATTEDAVIEGNETFTVGLAVSGTSAPVTDTDTATGTITNDDAASTGITISVSPSTVAENDTATTVTVTATLNDAVRSGATPVTVAVGATGDAATEGTDYAAVADFTVTIPDGETSGDATFTLTPTDDAVVEGDETLSVSGTTTVTGLTVTDTEVTLTDDDGRAEVTIGDASAPEGDSITFTVTLDKAVQGGLTVTPSFSGGTATEGTDYTANTTALTFAGTASETQTFKVATTEDALIETNETFTVSLTVTGTTAPVTDTDTATGTITNDDAASTGITISVSPSSVAEDDTATTVTVTATLNDAVRTSATPVTVAVGAAGDAATEGTDYATVADFTVTIPDGETSGDATFTLTPTDDSVVEGDETLSVSGTTAVAGLTLTNTEVTLTDDDGSAEVTIDNASALEGDSITFTVTLDKAVQGGLTVTPSFTDGTATSTDYTANTTALTFAGTASETQTFKVATTEDALIETNETFTVSLTVTGTTAPVTDTDTATGTITNDDAASTGITLSVDPTSVAEDDTATTVTVTATLNDAVRSGATPVTVVVGAAADAATEGTDYAAVADFTVTIPDGETSADTTFTLTPTDDEVVEGDEALSVSGTTTVTGLTVTNTEVTLTDDDGSAAVTVDDASAAEGDSITFTVTLDKAVQGGLTVTPSFSGGTATSTDYTANTTALTFAGTAGETQTFKVATTEDALIEGDETFTVGLAVSGTSAPVTDTDTATGTITNDDAASTGIALSVSPAMVAEDDTATTVTVTATLNDAVRSGATPVTVVVGAAADAATEGTDYATVADFTVTIPDGETSADTTFTLTPTDDDVVEGDETLSVSGTTTVTGLSVTNTEVTLTDDDGSAEVTIDDASAAEGDSITFTVTLDKAVQGGLTVTPSFSGGTATGGTDYTANTTALTFAGTAAETQTFKVATTEDAQIEANETFTVSLAVSGTTAPVTDTDTATGTITNDDAASTGITLSVSPSTVDEDAGATTVTVTATLNDAVRTAATPVTVAVGATDDDATEGTDYAVVADFTVTIPDGETSGDTTFTLTPTDDSVVEGDETLSVSGTTTVTELTVINTTVTLNDDDGGATVTIGDASAAEGDTITFTVTLDKAVQGGLTVTPSFADGTATKGTDYTENTASLTFTGNAGETSTLKVATTEDAAVESNETFTVSLAVSGTTVSVTATDTGTGSITDDDGSAGVTLTVNPTSVAEDAGATTVTVTATMTGGTRADSTALTVAVGAVGDGATEGTDYATVGDFTVTIPAGSTRARGTFTLTPTADSAVEGDETLSISGDATVERLAVSGATVTITDGDASSGRTVPALTIDDATAAEGDSLAFTVTLRLAVSGWSDGDAFVHRRHGDLGHRLQREHGGAHLHGHGGRDADVQGGHRRGCRGRSGRDVHRGPVGVGDDRNGHRDGHRDRHDHRRRRQRGGDHRQHLGQRGRHDHLHRHPRQGRAGRPDGDARLHGRHGHFGHRLHGQYHGAHVRGNGVRDADNQGRHDRGRGGRDQRDLHGESVRVGHDRPGDSDRHRDGHDHQRRRGLYRNHPLGVAQPGGRGRGRDDRDGHRHAERRQPHQRHADHGGGGRFHGRRHRGHRLRDGQRPLDVDPRGQHRRHGDLHAHPHRRLRSRGRRDAVGGRHHDGDGTRRNQHRADAHRRRRQRCGDHRRRLGRRRRRDHVHRHTGQGGPGRADRDAELHRRHGDLGHRLHGEHGSAHLRRQCGRDRDVRGGHHRGRGGREQRDVHGKPGRGGHGLGHGDRHRHGHHPGRRRQHGGDAGREPHHGGGECGRHDRDGDGDDDRRHARRLDGGDGGGGRLRGRRDRGHGLRHRERLHGDDSGRLDEGAGHLHAHADGRRRGRGRRDALGIGKRVGAWRDRRHRDDRG